MTFLKKLGQTILKVGSVALGIEPIVAALLPAQAQGIATQVVSDLNQLAAVIVQIEAIGNALQLPGAQKLTAATPLIAQEILKSALLVGKKIAQPDVFQRGASKIADGMVDVLNSLHEDGVKADDKT